LNNDQNDALASFASSALRRNKPGSYEQLLCQHLIKSVAAPPIEKIRLVSEAALLVQDNDIDKELLEVLFKVVTSFIMTRQDIRDPYLWHGAFSWSFQRSNEAYKRYVVPWFDHADGLFHKEIKYSDLQKYDAMNWGGQKFFFVTQRLHIAGLDVMESKFTAWAMPQIMTIFEKLSRLIDPDVYMDMLERVRQ
jgi:hypothetical protein